MRRSDSHHETVGVAGSLFSCRYSFRICLEHDAYHGLARFRSRLHILPYRVSSIIIDRKQSAVAPGAVTIIIVSDLRSALRDGNGFHCQCAFRSQSGALDRKHSLTRLKSGNSCSDNVILYVHIDDLEAGDGRLAHTPCHRLGCDILRKHCSSHDKGLTFSNFLGSDIQ